MDFYLVQLYYSLYKKLSTMTVKYVYFFIQSFWIYNVFWNNKYLFIYLFKKNNLICMLEYGGHSVCGTGSTWLLKIDPIWIPHWEKDFNSHVLSHTA